MNSPYIVSSTNQWPFIYIVIIYHSQVYLCPSPQSNFYLIPSDHLQQEGPCLQKSREQTAAPLFPDHLVAVCGVGWSWHEGRWSLKPAFVGTWDQVSRISIMWSIPVRSCAGMRAWLLSSEICLHNPCSSSNPCSVGACWGEGVRYLGSPLDPCLEPEV